MDAAKVGVYLLGGTDQVRPLHIRVTEVLTEQLHQRLVFLTDLMVVQPQPMETRDLRPAASFPRLLVSSNSFCFNLEQ